MTPSTKTPIPPATGNCFESALATLMNLESYSVNADPRLCHGIVINTGVAAGHRMLHAWVELDGIAFDFSNGRRYVGSTLPYYVAGNIKPTDVYRYTFEEAVEQMYTHETYGPWDAHLLEQITSGAVL